MHCFETIFCVEILKTYCLILLSSLCFKYRAFEEKRKEQEEREHQIREQILQERKQKFEEVTEKFQRAHIPLSQRRRAGILISRTI